jgi:RimJ/RimL family protein N-acetyltransferase
VLCDESVAGYVLSFIRKSNGKREVGYWLGQDFWGKGVATAALTEFLREETTRPLSAHTTTENVGSQRVLLKCGFKASGTEKYFLERAGREVEDLLFILS